MPPEQGRSPAPAEPVEPWRSFLRDLDERLDDLLKRRYYEELRPYLLSKQSWHDSTLELWLEMVRDVAHLG